MRARVSLSLNLTFVATTQDYNLVFGLGQELRDLSALCAYFWLRWLNYFGFSL